MANAYDDLIPEVWSGLILAELDKRLVLANVCNTSWQGEIRSVGDTVRILGLGDVTSAAYTNNSTSISYTTPTDSTRSLTIDNDRYAAVQVDDLEEIQAVPALLQGYTSRIAYALAKDIDDDIALEYANSDLTAITATSSDDHYDVVVEARQTLEEADNEGPYWMVVSPAFAAGLRKNDFFVSAEGAGAEFRRNGVLGNIAGFTVYESNNLAEVSDVQQLMFGTPLSIAHARQLMGNVEAIRLESRFATGIRARIAWGNKVLDGTRLGVIEYTPS